MSNDRELLALAAKAAGARMTDYSDRTPDIWVIRHVDGMWREWNPLTDDGDALRLAVKLKMNIWLYATGAEVNTDDDPVNYTEAKPDDPCAATRRAIVRAAAEIGKAMP